MDPGAVPADAVLLLDTTVYIDGMKQAGLPEAIRALLANHVIRHSALCVGNFHSASADSIRPIPTRRAAGLQSPLSWTGSRRTASWT